MEKEKRIYTVTELTRGIKIALEDNFSTVWVEGEISNVKRPASGHLYFTLKDEQSQLRAVMFRGRNQGVKFDIESGLQVVCFGQISVYEKQGQHQLYVEVIEPKGVGALTLAFEKLKEKLQKEGLFESAHKKPLPLLPQCIGVVTSPTGAVIRDILNVLKRRFSNLHIILNPVAVQGEKAAGEIAAAIEEFNQLANVDVIIVGRGGGSLEDLWAFNEEVVARAIYDSHIPIISAVGHEIDTTVSDFVADLRAPTPSVAAELVVPVKAELQEKIATLRKNLKVDLINRLSFMENRLGALIENRIFRDPLNIIEQRQQEVDDLGQLLEKGASHCVELSEMRFKNYVGKLDALSPLKVLLRGYSITLKSPGGEIIRDVSVLKKKDLVKTSLSRGSFISEVKEICGKSAIRSKYGGD